MTDSPKNHSNFSEKPHNQNEEEAARHREEDLHGDIVNEESDASFPCSDPPGWISEKNKKTPDKSDENK